MLQFNRASLAAVAHLRRVFGAPALSLIAALSWGACEPAEDSEAAELLADEVGSTEAALRAPEKPGRDKRPNILLIVADDLGYSDIGAFGGEIRTPHLNKLATQGRLLTDYHTAATCSPTRSMLISGTDHHLVGLGTMGELIRPEQQGKPGYEGYLNQRSLSIADLLRDSGYHTYTAGKWHLGLTEDKSPKAWGFEQSFILAQGGGSHFAPDPARRTSSDNTTYRENGVQVEVPPDFYSTDFYTDKLLEYLESHRGDGKPFFAFAAFTTPHWPLQAPDAFIDRYKGRYDAGYDAIRKARIARQKRLGVIPWDFEPNEPLPSSPDRLRWDELTPEQKKVEARHMEIYAAMVENLDYNVGRLIAYLERTGQYDNTFVFFQSDNGAEGGGTLYPVTPANDNSFENLGRRYSNIGYSERWAEVSAAPFKLWKAHPSEGGVTVPAIARLPRQRLPRLPFSGITHVTDLAPTFLELARTPDPGDIYKGRSVHPITGKSLLPRLENRALSVRTRGSVLVDELFGRRYVRRDNWKLVWIEPPFGTGDWQLYDLSSDGAESTDIAQHFPEIVSELRAEWDAYVTRVGVVLPETAGF